MAQSDAVTAYGWGVDALWQGMCSGRTAITSTQRFAERGFLTNQAAIVPGLDACAASSGSRVMAMLTQLLAPLQRQFDPATPLILATTVGEIEYVERALLDSSPRLLQQASGDQLLHRIQAFLGLSGEAMVISAACASSATAVARAASMVRHGESEQVLVVACDAISEFVFAGFSGLLGMSDHPARPFDAQRNGLTLGEGAAWVLIRRAEATDSAYPSTEIAGWGSTSDALHMTAPDREARGLRRAIAKALAMAGHDEKDVDFIAAHGTATAFSDGMEMTAFRQSFSTARPTFSTKGGIGHTLGAAGLLQLLVAARALASSVVPPTVGMVHPDEAAAGWVSSQPTPIRRASMAISTNSGFGGVNNAIVLARRCV